MTVAEQIDKRIAALGDWRGITLSRVRELIRVADPQVTEAVKWVKPSNPLGVPIWEREGILCTGEIYKTHVKLTFAHGAALDDPHKLFNSGFGGGTRRAIDIREGEVVAAIPFKALITRAASFNLAKSAERAAAKRRR